MKIQCFELKKKYCVSQWLIEIGAIYLNMQKCWKT